MIEFQWKMGHLLYRSIKVNKVFSQMEYMIGKRKEKILYCINNNLKVIPLWKVNFINLYSLF